MNLTNKQKIYGVILGVGLASLVVDRLLIGSAIGPDEASAGSVHTYAGAMDLPDLAVVTDRVDRDARSRAPAMGDRVAAVARQQGVSISEVRDAFVPPKSWLPEAKPGKVVQQSLDLSPETFQNQYKLMAVIITDDARHVVVNGDMLRVGELVDGYRLVAVERQSAIFKSGEATVELTLLSDR